MIKPAKIVIASAFGRGFWLAAELAKLNLEVLVIDLTHKFQLWTPEDIEGPFGFFKSEVFSDTQIERIFSSDPYEEIPNGFTIWLENGPFEMKGPLTTYRFEQLSVLDQHWFKTIEKDFASTRYHEFKHDYNLQKTKSLHHPFFIKSVGRTNLSRSIEWLEEKGVKVYQNSNVVDIAIDEKHRVSGIEISGDFNGVMNVNQLCWMFTGEQTRFINSRLLKTLFPQGVVEPDWAWLRYRVSLAECEELQLIPDHMLLIDDVLAPRTHSNFMVMQRTAQENQFDMWLRLPALQRFNKDYLKFRGEEVIGKIKKRLPVSDPKIHNYPQEFYYSHDEIGPSWFPVFNSSIELVRNFTQLSNLHFASPEVTVNFSKQDHFQKLDQIYKDISIWWEGLRNVVEREQESSL